MEPSTVDVMSKFMINNRTDALKTDVFLFCTEFLLEI